MFEAYTYDELLKQALENAPEGIDTRQGSIFFDAVSGIILKMASLYNDLDLVFSLTQINTMTGEFLDMRASEYGVERRKATKARYNVTFVGTAPQNGERFFANGLYFVLGGPTSNRYLEAELPGIIGNEIPYETAATPVNNITTLKAAIICDILEYGTDEESDDELRARLKEKISSPVENGNKQHYKTWCESYSGVGYARIFPLWNGPNTVKAVLINPLGLPCSAEVVKEVQQYVDPATKGYTALVDGVTYVVGDGLGEGVANIGAHFTAAPATAQTINVTLNAELSQETTKEEAEADITDALTSYFRNLATSSQENNEIVVRISAINVIIAGITEIIDFNTVNLNGTAENVKLTENDVPKIGTVTINVI